MRTPSILLALSLAATSFADSVPEGIAPSTPSPEGCVKSVDGNFTIGIAVLASKAKRESLTEAATNTFSCTLHNGILHDLYNRTGSIVANYQFQFDGPPQAGAIYTGGFSICKNNSLALGGSTIFWRCTSGDFMNLYDRNVAAQCQEANILVSMLNQPTPSSSSIAPSSTDESSSSASISSASISGTITPITKVNGTQSTSVPASGSSSLSPSASITAGSSASTVRESAKPTTTGSAGGAAPTRIPRAETFGAVIGILGAALML